MKIEIDSTVTDITIEFIGELILMQELYSSGEYTRAEKLRDELSEKLDDVMRDTHYK